MSKAILIIDMPSCCSECFAFNDDGDYPMCLITGEQKGYRFKTREQKMDECPLIPIPENNNNESDYYQQSDCTNSLTEQYKECIVCGELNDSYREYCSRCNRSLKIKTVGAATSTEKL